MNIAWRPSPALRALLPAAALFALLALLSTTPDWRRLEHKLYDLFTVASAPGESELPIFLVAIDDQSLAEVGMRWPWPRSLHAQLVDNLTDAGAGVVAFDVIFDYPTEPAEDWHSSSNGVPRWASPTWRWTVTWCCAASRRRRMRCGG